MQDYSSFFTSLIDCISCTLINMEEFSPDFTGLMSSGSGVVEDNYTLSSTCAESTLLAANGTVLPAPVAISARVSMQSVLVNAVCAK